MTMNLKKGFTLIELLVVVAIIGILSSVVLASLNQARVKGADATVKSQMASMQGMAEVFYDAGGTYQNLCTSDAGIVQAIAVIAANDGNSGQPVCSTNSSTPAHQKWAVSTTLRSGTTWCVDNSGWKKEGSTSANSGVCS